MSLRSVTESGRPCKNTGLVSDMMAKVPPSQMKLSRGRRNTHLRILTQVDPFGDVVDGGDPLEEEAAEGR